MITRVISALGILSLSLCTLPLAAQVRGNLNGVNVSVLRLEPDAEGHYALPRSTGPPVPLLFVANRSAVSVYCLELDQTTGLLAATLQSTGEIPVSAWTVAIRAFDAHGTLLSEQRRTQDWAESADGRPRAQPETEKAVSPVHDQGLLYPGQLARVELGALPIPPGNDNPVDHVLLTVAMTLREDGSYTGDAKLARRVLSMRTASAEERTYWLERLRTELAKADSPEEAIAGAEALLQDLRAASDSAPPSVVAARSRIATNLAGSLETARRDPEHAASLLRDLADWMEVQLEKTLPFLSDKLTSEAPADSSIEDKADEDPGIPNETLNCDCGGSMSAVSTRNISERCTEASHAITVTESWTFQCKNADGVAILSPSPGTLVGTGGCVEDFICIPDRYCQPVFSPPEITEEGIQRYWTRTVQNAQVAVGPCTSRCVATTNDLLEATCNCDPRPAPRCSFDGCPILIETGQGGFELTDLDRGVHFDLDGDGVTNRTAWTLENGDDAWLALDRNGNGLIDDGTELFGDKTFQPPSEEPNGFLALAVFDRASHGGDEDGRISEDDLIFGSLRLWIDRDHDGVSSATELIPLAEAGIAAIELNYFRSTRQDRHGNNFRYAARVWLVSGAQRLATDVFLDYEP